MNIFSKHNSPTQLAIKAIEKELIKTRMAARAGDIAMDDTYHAACKRLKEELWGLINSGYKPVAPMVVRF